MVDVESYEESLSIKAINAEQEFAMQNDRIAMMRSHGFEWGEAVQELRDQLVGLEDEEFWDGIPTEIRSSMALMDEHEQRKVRKQYAPYGWLTMPCTAYPLRDSRGKIMKDENGDMLPVFVPSVEDLANQLRCVRRLAARLKLTWRTQKKTWIGYNKKPEHLK